MRLFRAYSCITIISSLLLAGCATTYEFASAPEGATVYQSVNGRKALLGVTPFTFKKSSLPEDRPFSLTFERAGYESLEVLISPTGEAKTKVAATLRPGKADAKDPTVIRMREVVATVFKIQELTYQKRTVDALALLQDLERREPGIAEVFVLKGSIYASLNDPEQARTAWKQALALDPSLDRIRVELQKLDENSGGGVKK